MKMVWRGNVSFQEYFFNKDILLNIPPIKIFKVLNIYVKEICIKEGMSHFLNLEPSFCFMKCRSLH